MKTATFTDFRQNLKKYFDSVIDDSDAVIINREGGSGIVIMSLDEYNSLVETEYIMSSAETMKRIKAGTQSIAEGRGKRIRNVDELIDFADKL